MPVVRGEGNLRKREDLAMYFTSPQARVPIVPTRAHAVLVSLGWETTYGDPITYTNCKYGPEHYEWHEAICMELLDLVEGLNK